MSEAVFFYLSYFHAFLKWWTTRWWLLAYPTSQKSQNGLMRPIFIQLNSNLSFIMPHAIWMLTVTDPPATPTKTAWYLKFSTVFFINFGWNLLWVLIMAHKLKMSSRCLLSFFDLPTQPPKTNQYWKFLTAAYLSDVDEIWHRGW